MTSEDMYISVMLLHKRVPQATNSIAPPWQIPPPLFIAVLPHGKMLPLPLA